MKRNLIAAFVAAVALICFQVAAAGGPPAEAESPKSPNASKPHKYVGNKKCKSCHGKNEMGDQLASWKKTKHATAWETLASDQAKEWAKEKGLGDPQTVDECVKCHVTAHDVPDKLVSRKFDRQAGVQCEACHGPGKDYRKKKVMIDHDLAVSRGLVEQSVEVCTACHNDESPAWDAERYTNAAGKKVGFDYKQAVKAIAHPVPEDFDPSSMDPE